MVIGRSSQLAFIKVSTFLGDDRKYLKSAYCTIQTTGGKPLIT